VFKAPSAVPQTQNMYGIAVKSDGVGYIVGDAGFDYQFNINAISTTALPLTPIAIDTDISDDKGTGIPAQNLRKIVFVDHHIGYITGVNGLLLKTIDGGAHWYNETSGSGTNIPNCCLKYRRTTRYCHYR
jgi:photosystem II stability/assembly factor-like uncharacterized protein